MARTLQRTMRMSTLHATWILPLTLSIAVTAGCSAAYDQDATSADEGGENAPGPGGKADGTDSPEDPSSVDARTHAATAYMISRVGKHSHYIDVSGIGAYYGDKSAYHSLSREKKIAYLDERLVGNWAGQGETIVDELIPTGCVQWTMEVTDVFFGGGGAESGAQGADPLWRTKVWDVTYADSLRGTTLARQLVEHFDWSAVLVTPDFRNPSIPEDQRQAVLGGQGYADAQYLTSGAGTTEGRYPGVTIAQKITKFDTNSEALAKLNAVPFGVLVIKGGLHVAILHNREGKLLVSETDRSNGPESKNLFYVDDALEGIVEVYAKTVYGGDYRKAYDFWSDFLVVVPPQYALSSAPPES